MSETERTVVFLREQYRHARNWRDLKRRLAVFGFELAKTAEGPVVTALPRHKVVCPVPQDLLA